MLAILNSNPILSLDGKPVHGRFFVYQKDTNQVAEVLTYDSNRSLVSGQNPIYTDIYGFPEYEVILEDQIYSVVVERYLGDYSDPKTDDRPEMWSVCNSYYLGAQIDTVESGTIYSVSSLPDVDVEIGTVNVILDSTSTWTLTTDTYITAFEGSMENVVTDGYTLYVNGTAMN